MVAIPSVLLFNWLSTRIARYEAGLSHARRELVDHLAAAWMKTWVTPLVDVVLVLLIIFMVVIPAMDQAVEVQVPGIFNVDEKADEKAKPFVLSLSDKGALFLDEDEVKPALLEQTLRAASRREPQRKARRPGPPSRPNKKLRINDERRF